MTFCKPPLIATRHIWRYGRFFFTRILAINQQPMGIKYIPVALLLFISFAIHGQIIFVNTSATGNNDGSSWEHAFTNLQDALATAAYGDTIWVAAGTYTPTATTIRTVSFHLVDGVKMFGGFTGVETQLSQRDWEANPAILSGDIGVPGDSTDNSYTVVTIEKADSTTVLDGFIIAYGNADNQGSGSSTGPTKSGGGMYIVGTTGSGELRPVIRNCRIEHNHARFNGGGIYMKSSPGSAATPYFEQCVIFENSAFTGGGVYKKDGSDSYSMEMNNCTIEKNQAFNGGGVAFFNDTGNENLIFYYCYFTRNSAVGEGGGVLQKNGLGAAIIVFQNCFIQENYTQSNTSEGAAISAINILYSDSYKIHSSLLYGNLQAINEGTFVAILAGSIEFDNSNFISNSSVRVDEGSLSLLNCSFTREAFLVNNSISKFVNSSFINNTEEARFQFNIDPYSLGTSVVNIENSILNPSKDSSGQIIYLRQGSSLTLTHTLVNVPQCDSIATPGTNVTCGPGMLYNLDPMFLDTAAGDYRLHPCSPARDAGDNAIVDSLGILTDIAGMPRIQGGVVDMGAWESEAFSIKTDSIQAAPCAGASGSLWLDLDSGCPPFFVTNGTDPTLSDTSRFQLPLPAGTHTLVITDGRMDMDTLQITIPGAPPLLAQLTGTDVVCPGIAGSASIIPQGGTAPYSYLWSNGDTTATTTGLPAGLHTVTLTDANGCTLTDSVEIGSSGHLTLGISIQPISCHDSGDGIAAITPQDGTWPFTWLWNDGSADSLRNDLAGGNYSVTVTDALGCTDELSFFLPAPDSLSATASATGLNCAGSNTGSASATATGGTPPYSYLWSNSSTFQTIENLAPGWYSVTVTDVKGCQDTTGVLVQAPPVLSLSIAGATTVCPGDSTVLAAQASGGTPPYTYQWNTPGIPPADSSITVGPGSYSLTVVDANGCSKTTSHIVSEDPPIEILSEVQPVTNPGQPNGAVEVQLTFGGTAPYQYQWSHGPTTASVDSLAAGEYSLTITDALGCTVTFTFEVLLTSTKNPSAAELQALIVPNPSGSAGARLQLSGPWPQHLLLSLHDTHGRLLWQRLVLRSEEINLPGKNTPTGSYWLVLRSEEGEVLKGLKWVVVRE